jgi:hypothetical protein
MGGESRNLHETDSKGVRCMVHLGAGYGVAALFVASMHGWETIDCWRAKYLDAKFMKA